MTLSDDPQVVGLEEKLSLEALYAILFFDSSFAKEVRSFVKSASVFTRSQLEATLDALNEGILWDALFAEDDMPSFRRMRDEIKDRRNDVMHYHKMSGTIFDETRRLLKVVNAEIDEYLEKVRNDVLYPKAKADAAKKAA